MSEEANENELIEIEESDMTEEESQNFMWGEAMVSATLKHSDARETLSAKGLSPLGQGDAPLDALASFLDNRDQLQEPGELLLSAEPTLITGGSSPFYFLDLRPQGVARDWCVVDDVPLVQDSLVRSRLGNCVWDEIANGETKPSKAATSFKHIAGLLGIAYFDILATNFIFARSRRFRAAKTIWEQLLDCEPAHQLMIDTAKPDVLWVAGNDPEILERTGYPLLVSWKRLGSNAGRLARGKFEFCGRQLRICVTPDLTTWDATLEEHQPAIRWAIEGLAA